MDAERARTNMEVSNMTVWIVSGGEPYDDYVYTIAVCSSEELAKEEVHIAKTSGEYYWATYMEYPVL